MEADIDSKRTRNVLVVDDDPTCLLVIASILTKLNCKAITVTNPNDALCTIRINGGDLDLVISDVYMPDMNGYQLQQKIAQEFSNLPVILMSAESNLNTSRVICKPINPEDLKGVLKSGVEVDADEVVNQKKKKNKKKGLKSSKSKEGREGKVVKVSSTKKPKLVWNNPLHNRFLEALRILGLERAVPKKILEVMNVPGLTRENVASHLQKYRIFLRRVTDASFKMKRGEGFGSFSQPLIHRRICHFPAMSPASLEPSPSSSSQLEFRQPLFPHAAYGHSFDNSGDFFSGDVRANFSAPQPQYITQPNTTTNAFSFQDGNEIVSSITPVSSSSVNGSYENPGSDGDGLLSLLSDPDKGNSGGGGLLSDVVAGYGFRGSNTSETHDAVTIFADLPNQVSGDASMAKYATYEDGFDDFYEGRFVQSFHQSLSQNDEVFMEDLNSCWYLD